MEKNQSQQDTNITEEQASGVGGFLFEIAKVFLLALIIIVPIRVFLFQPFFVQGASMEPNFYEGEYLVVNEFGYKQTQIGFDSNDLFTVYPFKELERGDIVVFRYPKNPNQFFIKRVIGLPGEGVEIRSGSVVIYEDQKSPGKKLNEPYVQDTSHTGSLSRVSLQADEYFVMGDNREFSHDSRAWGPLDKEYVIGKVLFRAWPPGKIENYN